MKDKIDCDGTLHAKVIEGMKLFNEGKFFDAHEELEIAWNEETGKVRDLYQGILQVAVTYLHITRGNYNGAIKVYERSMRRLEGWPDICRGIRVGQFKKDAAIVMDEIERLGAENIEKFNPALFKPIQWSDRPRAQESDKSRKRIWICDKCGSEMNEMNCKVSCPNCGNRFDCSDLNIYFD